MSALAALQGLAIGDALGMPTQLMSRAAVASRWGRISGFEAAGPEFHARVLAGFREMAAADPDHWITVRTIGSVDHVADEIRRSLVERGVL